MPIRSEIAALIERLNQKLNQIEQEATQELNLTRVCLERFPNNAALIQMVAFLNTSIFWAETERRKIQTLLENLSETDATANDDIQEAGEDLTSKLDRVLETKSLVVV